MAYVCESFFKRAKLLRHALLSLRLTLRGASRPSQASHSPRERLRLRPWPALMRRGRSPRQRLPGTRGWRLPRCYDAVLPYVRSRSGRRKSIGTCGPTSPARARLGALDFFVTAYRANPGLLSVLLSSANSARQGTFSSSPSSRRCATYVARLIDQCDSRPCRNSLGAGARRSMYWSAKGCPTPRLVASSSSQRAPSRRISHRLYASLAAFKDGATTECRSEHYAMPTDTVHEHRLRGVDASGSAPNLWPRA